MLFPQKKLLLLYASNLQTPWQTLSETPCYLYAYEFKITENVVKHNVKDVLYNTCYNKTLHLVLESSSDCSYCNLFFPELKLIAI